MKTTFLMMLLACLLAWPQMQGPAQTFGTVSFATPAPKPEDTINQLKNHIDSKFDSIAYQINRIASNRKVRYVTRPRLHKVDHYRVDTVLVFIDTCFNQPQLDTSRLVLPQMIPADKKQTWLQRIFNHKKERPTYLKVIQ